MFGSKIEEIYNELIIFQDNLEHPNLFTGKCGVTLFYFYYSRLMNNKGAYEKGMELLNTIFDDINAGFNHHSFAGGLAGIFWCIQHLQKNEFIDYKDKYFLGELDDYLFYQMTEEFNHHHYDYLHGAIGIALYFMERKNSTKGHLALKKVIDSMIYLSNKDNDGLKWLSTIDLKTNKEGYDISLSHGMSSIITILSKIYRFGIKQKEIKYLVTGAVNYLLNQKLPKEKYNSIFPNHAHESSNIMESSRLAWCYGDLGISTALWAASETFKSKHWRNEALELLLSTVKRKDLQKNIVLDAGLCHGAAGIANTYNKMYFYTGMKEFKTAADYWLDQTMQMAKFTDGLAGFKSWQGRYGWVNNGGFLEGISGIGLALISKVSKANLDWDECLLLS